MLVAFHSCGFFVGRLSYTNVLKMSCENSRPLLKFIVSYASHKFNSFRKTATRLPKSTFANMDVARIYLGTPINERAMNVFMTDFQFPGDKSRKYEESSIAKWWYSIFTSCTDILLNMCLNFEPIFFQTLKNKNHRSQYVIFHLRLGNF